MLLIIRSHSGIKKGKAVITAKIKAGKKNYQKTVKVTVTKKKDVLPVESERPSVTEEPTVTEEPKIYGEAGKISAYDAQNANYTLDIDSSNICCILYCNLCFLTNC